MAHRCASAQALGKFCEAVVAKKKRAPKRPTFLSAGNGHLSEGNTIATLAVPRWRLTSKVIACFVMQDQVEPFGFFFLADP